jgi:general secretion pathway protein D
VVAKEKCGTLWVDMKFVHLSVFFTCLLLSACSLPPQVPSKLHVIETPEAAATLTPPSIKPVRLPAMPPAPTARVAQEVFSVVVNDVSVKTLLFALARDNKLNVDIHPSVGGRVTLNATEQTLPQLLERIASQSDIRYEIIGNLLRVEPDTPYLLNYSIDYVNLLRQASSQVSVSSSLGSSGSGSATSSSGSDTSIKSTTDNKFWDTLVSNVCQIVLTANQNRHQRDEQIERQRGQERDDRLKVALELTKALQQGQPANTGTGTGTNQTSNAVSNANANSGAADLMRQVMGNTAVQNTSTNAVGGANGTTTNPQTPTTAATATSQCGSSSGVGATGGGTSNNPIMVNKESGVLGVNSTSKGHERVRAFIDRVMSGARRQVLIEATIVEVQLSAASQSGINWSQVISTGAAKGLTVNLTPSSLLTSTSAATIGYSNSTSALGNITAAISLLESFGKTKVLSSPKLSVINNQTAIIKVVDNYVYVTLNYTPAQFNGTSGVVVAPAAYTSVINTIPVGFVMAVTPQIADSGDVTLNVHPSITRVISNITDPNPVLLNSNPPILNLIPVVQTRELESILRVQSGEIAVLGGLMQESDTNTEQGVPGVNRIPVLGALAGQRSESRAKTELVVFMRPVVIKDASLTGDYKEYKSQLPTSTFFNGSASEAWGVQK